MTALRLPARLESIESFRTFMLEKIKHETGLKGLLRQVELALEELLVNIIHYAYPDGNGDIEVEYHTAGSGKLDIVLKDWGVPFNPLAQHQPDLSADIGQRKIGGLGIHLTKQMASQLSYQREGCSNVLRLGFRTQSK